MPRPKSAHDSQLTSKKPLGALLPLTLLAVSTLGAAAENQAAPEQAQPAQAGSDSAAGQSAFNNQWNFVVGAGVLNLPRYPGSRDDYTRGLPVLSANYGRYFIGGGPGGGTPAGLGAYLVRTEHWAVGVNVGGDFRKPRRESDAPILHGWGDIPGTVRGGMFVSYSVEWLSIRGSISGAGHNEGETASLSVTARFHPIPRLTVSFGPEATWADERYAMTYFGIDTAQSEIAGVAPYRARAGLNTIGAGADARYALTEHWSVAAHATYGRLQGDAATSPVTTDKTQKIIGAFAFYRF